MNSAAPQSNQSLNIVVGMSGGVDSSVAAYLLLKQGHHVQGVFMKNWEEDDSERYCSAAIDLEDAEKVARQLQIDLTTRNFSAEYWDRVFEYFLEEYKFGRTPNPDVICNKEIKFKTFLEHALDLGADYIATGHYARTQLSGDYVRLLKGQDHNKDQSYFLYALNQQQLSKALFPLGELSKPQVRAIAEQQGFANATKKDSTGICFIGERNFKDFLKRYLPAKPGDMRTPEGEPLGKHDGLMYYTLGQRQGLGIGGRHDSNGQPWFVVGKDLSSNTLIVAQGHDHPLLFSQSLTAKNLNWICHPPERLPYVCYAKTRYRQTDQACRIIRLDDNECEVIFDAPQRAVTPGQSVVFYQAEECLGGGIIDSTAY
ncbi:MAG: tRNA 2-thiouridylase [Gammaproteobacteria bacterium SG8_11]|nr:MAG: tRNA 2-thiouridylase [Gammaproteobacteria bacterium SG8_11]